MAIAIDPNQVTQYILRADRKLEEAKQTVWELGILDSRLRRWIKDATIGWEANSAGADKAASVGLYLQRRAYLLAQFGIRGWRNLLGADGRPIEAETTKHTLTVGSRMGLTHPMMDQIEPYIDELAGEIDRINSLTGEQIKN